MAYDVTLRFTVDDDEMELNLTAIEMSTVTGSGDCFADGPLSFTLKGPYEIHIPYLLRECMALFTFETIMVCLTTSLLTQI